MARNLNDLSDEPLDDDDAPQAEYEDLMGRLSELLSDHNAQSSTINFLESLEEQLREKGWLSGRQKAAIEEIENRRDRSRSGRF